MREFLNKKVLLSLQNWLSSKGLMKLPNTIQDFRAYLNK